LVPNSDNKNKYNFNRTVIAVLSLLTRSISGRSVPDDYLKKNSSITEKYEK